MYDCADEAGDDAVISFIQATTGMRENHGIPSSLIIPSCWPFSEPFSTGVDRLNMDLCRSRKAKLSGRVCGGFRRDDCTKATCQRITTIPNSCKKYSCCPVVFVFQQSSHLSRLWWRLLTRFLLFLRRPALMQIVQKSNQTIK